MNDVAMLKVKYYDDIVNTKNKEYKELVELYRKQNKKLQRIENYLDNQHDIPIELLINIKNIIHGGEDEE